MVMLEQYTTHHWHLSSWSGEREGVWLHISFSFILYFPKHSSRSLKYLPHWYFCIKVCGNPKRLPHLSKRRLAILLILTMPQTGNKRDLLWIQISAVQVFGQHILEGGCTGNHKKSYKHKYFLFIHLYEIHQMYCEEVPLHFPGVGMWYRSTEKDKKWVWISK